MSENDARKFTYNTICRENGSSSSRVVGAVNITRAIDTALNAYERRWKTTPDSIEVKYTGTYSFNQN